MSNPADRRGVGARASGGARRRDREVGLFAADHRQRARGLRGDRRRPIRRSILRSAVPVQIDVAHFRSAAHHHHHGERNSGRLGAQLAAARFRRPRRDARCREGFFASPPTSSSTARTRSSSMRSQLRSISSALRARNWRSPVRRWAMGASCSMRRRRATRAASARKSRSPRRASFSRRLSSASPNPKVFSATPIIRCSWRWAFPRPQLSASRTFPVAPCQDWSPPTSMR